jgi:hypothetical protein
LVFKEVENMEWRKWWVVSIITTLSLVNLGSISFALDNGSARDTIRGLRGVYVAIEPNIPEIKEDELTEDQLRADTEMRLRLAGIKMLTLEDLQETDGHPRLCVYVAIMSLKTGKGYVVRINVELHQTAYLARDPDILADAATWRNETMGISHSLDDIRNRVKDLVDRFVMVYRSVNPRGEDLTMANPPGRRL